jgi:hypothetical protein
VLVVTAVVVGPGCKEQKEKKEKTGRPAYMPCKIVQDHIFGSKNTTTVYKLEYDDKGRIKRAVEQYENHGSSLIVYSYDVRGLLHSVTKSFAGGGGVVMTLKYDSANVVVSYFVRVGEGDNTSTSEHEIRRGPDGRATSVEETTTKHGRVRKETYELRPSRAKVESYYNKPLVVWPHRFEPYLDWEQRTTRTRLMGKEYVYNDVYLFKSDGRVDSIVAGTGSGATRFDYECTD